MLYEIAVMNLFGVVVLFSMLMSFLVTRHLLFKLTLDRVYSDLVAVASCVITLYIFTAIKPMLE